VGTVLRCTYHHPYNVACGAQQQQRGEGYLALAPAAAAAAAGVMVMGCAVSAAWTTKEAIPTPPPPPLSSNPPDAERARDETEDTTQGGESVGGRNEPGLIGVVTQQGLVVETGTPVGPAAPIITPTIDHGRGSMAGIEQLAPATATAAATTTVVVAAAGAAAEEEEEEEMDEGTQKEQEMGEEAYGDGVGVATVGSRSTPPPTTVRSAVRRGKRYAGQQGRGVKKLAQWVRSEWGAELESAGVTRVGCKEVREAVRALAELGLDTPPRPPPTPTPAAAAAVTEAAMLEEEEEEQQQQELGFVVDTAGTAVDEADESYVSFIQDVMMEANSGLNSPSSLGSARMDDDGSKDDCGAPEDEPTMRHRGHAAETPDGSISGRAGPPRYYHVVAAPATLHSSPKLVGAHGGGAVVGRLQPGDEVVVVATGAGADSLNASPVTANGGVGGSAEPAPLGTAVQTELGWMDASLLEPAPPPSTELPPPLGAGVKDEEAVADTAANTDDAAVAKPDLETEEDLAKAEAEAAGKAAGKAVAAAAEEEEGGHPLRRYGTVMVRPFFSSHGTYLVSHGSSM
jgi:hypothetical protein